MKPLLLHHHLFYLSRSTSTTLPSFKPQPSPLHCRSRHQLHHHHHHRHSESRSLERVLESLKGQSLQSACTTYAALLRSCDCPSALFKGKLIHKHMMRRGDQALPKHMGNMLVSMYGKCQALEEAEQLFWAMPERDVISWTAIISACAQNGRPNVALRLFLQMTREGVQPNKVTFVTLVSACGKLRNLSQGKQIHGLIEHQGLGSDVIVGTALVKMYGNCGCVAEARTVFDVIQNRNVICWTTMVGAYADNGNGRDALCLFEQMQREGIEPDKVSLVSILNVCVSPEYLEEGKAIHKWIISAGLDSDTVVANALLSMYSKCGNLDDAYRLFNRMAGRDVISWTAMIAALTQQCEGSKARQLFWQMQWEGAEPNEVTFLGFLDTCVGPEDLTQGKLIHSCLSNCRFDNNVVIGTALVNMYTRCGSLEDVEEAFLQLVSRNVLTWTAIISAYAQHGERNAALFYLGQMQFEGIEPDKIALVSVLDACGNKDFLLEGSWMHACISEEGFDTDLIVGNAILNMYGKCGSLGDACKLFESMPVHDVVSWSTLIGAYVQQGHGRKALECLHQMECNGLPPDKVTLVSVLDACASLACREEGQRIHDYIISHRLDVDIFVGNALVHMYSKCGTLKDAYSMFENMVCRDVISWNALIAACAQHGEGMTALQFLGQMQLEEVKPDKVTLISTLTACSHAGLVDSGCHTFISLDLDQEMVLTLEHYGCIIDMLGRAGELDDAEALIGKMPYTPNAIVLNSLLSSCGVYGDLQRGRRIADHVLKLDPGNPAPYVTLSNMYADKDMWDKVAEIRKEMASLCATKEPRSSLARSPFVERWELVA